MRINKKSITTIALVLMLCVSLLAQLAHAEELTLSLNVPDSTMASGTTIKVVPSLSDETIKKVKYIWETSDKKVATVSNGNVRAVGEGSATITCSTTIDDKTVQASFNVSVYVAVKSITVKKKSITLEVGKTEKVDATINPKNATNQQLTWTSSNPSVATVDENGRIKAVYGGECTITGTSKDGSEKSASVTVFVPSMSCSTKEVHLVLGRTSTIKVNLYTKNKSAIKADDNNARNNFWLEKIENDTLTYTLIPWEAGQCTMTITDPNSRKSTIKIKLITTAENGLQKGYQAITNDNTYKDWLRGYYNGDFVKISGYVKQVEYNGNHAFMLVSSKGKYDNWVYVEYDTSVNSQMPRFIEGDKVNIWGKAKGTYSYTTVLNAKKTVPQIDPWLIGDGKYAYFYSDYYMQISGD